MKSYCSGAEQQRGQSVPNYKTMKDTWTFEKEEIFLLPLTKLRPSMACLMTPTNFTHRTLEGRLQNYTLHSEKEDTETHVSSKREENKS